MADYALPVSVLSFSFIGSWVFDKVSLEQFDATEVTFEKVIQQIDIIYFNVEENLQIFKHLKTLHNIVCQKYSLDGENIIPH